MLVLSGGGDVVAGVADLIDQAFPGERQVVDQARTRVVVASAWFGAHLFLSIRAPTASAARSTSQQQASITAASVADVSLISGPCRTG